MTTTTTTTAAATSAAPAVEPHNPPRIPCQQALDIVMAQIRERLVKHEAFSNPSLVYFAVGYDFRIEFDLYGRQVQTAGLKGAYRVPYDAEGRPIALPVAVGLPAHARVERKGTVGKDKPRLMAGAHVVTREGGTLEQRAIDKEASDRASLVGAGVPAGSLGAEAVAAKD